MLVRFNSFDPGRKIPAIKVVRALSGCDLKTAKQYIDEMDGNRWPGEIFEVKGYRNFDEINEYALEHGVLIVLEQGEQKNPLPVHMLALKLVMHGFSVRGVETLADALTGVEDAEGSLREAAKMMKEVAP